MGKLDALRVAVPTIPTLHGPRAAPWLSSSSLKRKDYPTVYVSFCREFELSPKQTHGLSCLRAENRLGSVVPDASASEEASEFVLLETKRLVETAMLAAMGGLSYFLSNTLRIENYFSCFFPLPPLVSSLRWGASAGRKTMVATVLLLLVISGPLKAISYLLMHGFLGMAMGILWRLQISWGLSVLLCTLVRSMGAMGFLFLSSWLLRDNILELIIINAHASISYMLAAVGISIVPSIESIYLIFGMLVLLNCGSFVFLIHVLYAFFLRRLGLSSPLAFPSWLKAL